MFWRMSKVSRRESNPKICTSPSWTGVSVVSTRTTVVLPAPLGPSSPMVSPASTCRVRSSTAVNWPYRWVRCRQSMAGAVGHSSSSRSSRVTSASTASPSVNSFDLVGVETVEHRAESGAAGGA